jgi:hypothetical protein
MKRFFVFCLALGLALAARAQTSIDNVLTYRVTATDTVDVQARDTYITADLTGGSLTCRITPPAEGLLGLRITVVQLNAGAAAATTISATDGGTHFQAGASASSSVVFTANVFQRKVFVCMLTGESAYKWVLTGE